MSQCCSGNACIFSPSVPVGTTHRCLACPESDNYVHAPCKVQVVPRGGVLVQPRNSDDTPNQDTREFDVRLLSRFGAEKVAHDQFGICLKCWESRSQPPLLLEGTAVPIDVVAGLFNEWLTGSTRDREAIGQLKLLFNGDIARARNYFREEFEANAISQANGDRVAREGAFDRPFPRTGGQGPSGRGPAIAADARDGGVRGNRGFDLPARLQEADRNEGVARGVPPMDRGDLAAGVPAGQGAPSARLLRLRENFNPIGVKKKAKAGATFSKHQACNERFIFWLYEKHPNVLNAGLRHALDDLIADIDYSAIEAQYPMYQKRKGKKSLDERKKDHRIKKIREVISDHLGEPGLEPPNETICFDTFEQETDLFIEFLTQCRRENGGILKDKFYTGFRSSLSYLYRRYRRTMPKSMEIDLKESMEGIIRVSNEARQHGEGTLYDGDRELTWGLYKQFNDWFLAEGTLEGIFAAAFSKLTMTLACRGRSTAQVCVKHLLWQEDSLSISFGHLKDNQSGKNAIKKLPRHCYCNPIDHSCCVITGLFEYIATNPDIVSKPAEALFSGPLSAQAQRFGRFLSKILTKYESVINTKFGYETKDIGTHSWRKCASTHLNCGSTGGPTAAAACIRTGHSMGTNRDVYIMGEASSDQVCGRIMAGLPINLAEFAVSNVDFIALDAESTLSGVSRAEQQQKQATDVR